MEAEVAFYTEKGDDPIHIFKQNFKYVDLIIKKDYGLLLTKDFDWREGSMPVLSKPYCFILHDLIDHSCIGIKLLDKINPIRIAPFGLILSTVIKKQLVLMKRETQNN